MMKILRKTAIYILVAAFWLLIWQLLAFYTGAELILPSPLQTAKACIELAKTTAFYKSALFSLIRIMTGFISGVLLGVILGCLCAFSKMFDFLFSPMRNIIKATPVSSFILILLFWLDRSLVPSYIAALIVLPVVHSGVYEGIKSTDVLLLEMADIYKVSKSKKLIYIYGESVKSRLIAAATTSLGLAWKAGVAAEVLATPKNAIGTALYESKNYLETPQLFAWTILVILLSVILEKLIRFLLKVFHADRGIKL